MRVLSIGVALLMLAACQIGTHARNYGPAKGPAGAMLNLRLADKSRVTAELLAIEDSALVVLRDSQLVRIRLVQVHSGSAPKVSFDGRLRGNSRERLRLISRYPQGLSPELEARLLRAYAQDSVAEIAAFMDRVRESTARYRDQQEALKDGYRKIGPDFPSMGEHWLNRAIVMRGEVDPLKPPILEYIKVDGQPVLAGVAYAQLAYAEAPSSPIPAPSSAWHYHAGSVDEESFIASHAAHGAGQSSAGPRIAVLHAWLWVNNPAGLFATDNWALPWVRLGIDPPGAESTPDSVTLMAALAAGGEHYFTTLLRLQNGLSAETTERVGEILRMYAEQLDTGSRTTTAMASAWPSLNSELRAVCRPCSLAPSPP
jgi:hypothetical protein